MNSSRDKEIIKNTGEDRDFVHSEDEEIYYGSYVENGFSNEVPAGFVGENESWKEGNEKWIFNGTSWERDGKYEKDKNFTLKYKHFVIREMQERDRRFTLLYDQSFLDRIYHKHERKIELITLPLKHQINKYYKDLFKEEVKENFLEDEKEDFLSLTPEQAEEKINKFMISYIQIVKQDVKNELCKKNILLQQ